MDLKLFLAEFGYVANAPHGVARLRELVLVLAMQGRLVAHTVGEDASELMAKIEAEIGEAVRTKKMHRREQLPPVSQAESPHAIPSSWKWVRFGDVAQHNSGKTLDQVRNTGIPREYLTTSNLYWGRFEVRNLRTMLIREEELERCTARKNDLLICEGGDAGRAAVWTFSSEVCFQNHLHRARLFGGINPFFAFRFFEKLKSTGEIELYRKGIGVSSLSSKALGMIPFPLPPIDEQSRIVAKIDELMALCDSLEVQQQESRRMQDVVRRLTLDGIASTQVAAELGAACERFDEHIRLLFSLPDDVDELKGLVLDLAVSGRLQPKLQAPTSGAELLRSIEAARQRWAESATGQEQREALSAQKKARTQTALSPSDSIPEHWCWASLLQVSQAVIDCHHKTAPYVADGMHLVRTTDIRDGQLDLKRTKKVSQETYHEWVRRMRPQSGDLIFTREAPMGQAAMIPEGAEVCLGQRTMLIRLFAEHFNNQFLLYTIQSPGFQKRVNESAIGLTVKHLRNKDAEELIVAVPPKEEQDAIVQTVDRLFEMLDRYKELLRKKVTTAASLAKSAVSSLTGIAMELGGDERVKAPETLVIAKLAVGTLPTSTANAPLTALLVRSGGALEAKDLWQRFGGEVYTFYSQLKAEVAQGWIREPEVAEVRERAVEVSEN